MKTAMHRMQVNLRAEIKGNTLYGHASVFNQETYIPGEGYEEITRSAFDDVIASEETDVRALFNHDPTMLLGRQSAGTLRLGIDSEGLPFEVDLPDTTVGRDVRVLLERGDLNGASFGWIPDKFNTTTRKGGGLLRSHTSIKRLVDVSVVTFPAYQGATVALRNENPVSNRSRLIRARARFL
jgi:HK97 family phage prohead protease